jgi:hypothetical protein
MLETTMTPSGPGVQLWAGDAARPVTGRQADRVRAPPFYAQEAEGWKSSGP